MIDISLTIAEAIELGSRYPGLNDRIVSSFELALGVNQRLKVTITNGMTTKNRIPCIKAIRSATGCSFKDSKDWTDILGGKKASITLDTPELAAKLLADLTSCGCEGFLS